jgi:hypothetical protein
MSFYADVLAGRVQMPHPQSWDSVFGGFDQIEGATQAASLAKIPSCRWGILAFDDQNTNPVAIPIFPRLGGNGLEEAVQAAAAVAGILYSTTHVVDVRLRVAAVLPGLQSHASFTF